MCDLLKELTRENFIMKRKIGTDGINIPGIKSFFKKNEEAYSLFIEITNKIGEEATLLERLYYYFEYYLKDRNSELLCPVCKTNKRKFSGSFFNGYNKVCSKKCLYEDPNRIKTIQETNLKKYGVKNPSQNQEVKEKLKQTLIKKYGVDNIMKSDIGKQKFKESLIKKYGTVNTNKVEEIRQKIKEVNLKKYGHENYFLSDDFKKKNEKYLTQRRQDYYETLKKKLPDLTFITTKEEFVLSKSNNDFLFKCNKCNYEFKDTIISSDYTRLTKCPKCYPSFKSEGQTQIKNFLEELGITNIKENHKTILKDRKELDLYLEDYNLAIEYNGLMYHSYGKSKYTMFNNYLDETKGKTNHLKKTEECKELDLLLLHIFENEWLDPIKNKIWKSIIKSKLHIYDTIIYGRKCEIKEVSYLETSQFLEENHLQGKDQSSLRYGLYYNNELVSIMTFGLSRYNKEGKYEIFRFCNKLNYKIIGGASKLFNYFIKKHLKIGESVISYSDKRFSLGDLYNKLGFKKLYDTDINYFYFHEDNIYKLYSRYFGQKESMKKNLKIYDSGLTEKENMYQNRYRRIYDCGSICLKYIKEDK